MKMDWSAERRGMSERWSGGEKRPGARSADAKKGRSAGALIPLDGPHKSTCLFVSYTF